MREKGLGDEGSYYLASVVSIFRSSKQIRIKIDNRFGNFTQDPDSILTSIPPS